MREKDSGRESYVFKRKKDTGIDCGFERTRRCLCVRLRDRKRVLLGQ